MRMNLHQTIAATACGLVSAAALSCGGSSPSSPSPQPQPNPTPPPTVTAIAPAVGATGGGLVVTISGTGFAGGATVSIGGAAATNVVVAGATSLTATTPAHAAGSVDIVVSNPDGQSARLASAFAYEVPVSAPPAVATVGPSSGPVSGGITVSITGSGFAAGATVMFGATAATAVSVASGTAMTATAPAGNAGSVDLVVTNPDGQSGRLPNAFTYVAAAPPPPAPPPPAPSAPTVTGVSPASATAAGGTSVTISGTGFTAGATVSFGGAAATNVAINGGTSITATTPPHAAGAVDVVVTNPDGGSGRLTGGFTYTDPAPPPPPPVVVITITSAGVSPSTLTIAPGTRVRFVNNDALPHDMTSDPHPAHTTCPAINQVGMLLPGQSRETGAFTAVMTCGYHDHNDPDDPKWTGTILVR